MIKGNLCRRVIYTPLLRCLEKEEAIYMLLEVDERIIGQHLGAQELVKKVLRARYYWSSMVQDPKECVKKCNQCQQHGNIFNAPWIDLHVLTSPWPFSHWGLDILSMFVSAPGQLKYFIIEVDYFIKWVEEEALANIMVDNVLKFFKHNILTRFGVPQDIATGNGAQFIKRNLKILLMELKLK